MLVGCSQVLKILRYTSKLVLASALSKPDSELALRLKAFESSVGTSRSDIFPSQAIDPQRNRHITLYWDCSLKPARKVCCKSGTQPKGSTEPVML